VRGFHVIPVTLLVSLLGFAPALSRIDRPLGDLVLAALPRGHERAEIVVVDLEHWSVDSIPQRAASRRQIAALIDLLAADERRALGLDILLVDPTSEEADALLEASLTAHPRVIVGASLDTAGAGDDSGTPGERFATDNPRGWIHVVRGPGGRVDRYGLAGRVPESLAGRLARQRDPTVHVPSRPARVHVSSAVGDLQTRWAVVSASELLASPSAVDAFPAPAVVLVGLAGDAGIALDGHRLPGAQGQTPVPGVLLHALMVEEILTGRVVVDGGWAHRAAALFLFLSALTLVGHVVSWIRSRMGRPGRLPPVVGTLAVAGAVPLALPFAVVFAGLSDAAVPVTTLMLAGPLLLLYARTSAAIHRRLGYRRALHAGAQRLPTAVARSVRTAHLDENPQTRLASLLDAYEDLMYTLVVLLLATREYPRRPSRVARDLWHRQHTLPTILATFVTLEPELGERIGSLSRCEGDPQGQRLLASVAGAGAADSNGFVALRNTLAHDTTALWLTEDRASALGAILRRQLLSILELDGVGALLRETSLDENPPSSRDAEMPRPVRFGGASADGRSEHAGPWLVWIAPDGRGEPRLFRYRGLAKPKDWVVGDRGRLPTACFTPFGAAPGGERSELLLPMSRISEMAPSWLRIDYDGEA